MSNLWMVAAVRAGPTPNGVAVSPSGDRAYVANAGMHELFQYFRPGSVSVVDTDAQREIAKVPVARRPVAVAAHPSNGRVYVANLLSGNVSVIDGGSLAEITRVAVGRHPRGITVSPDGERVYVANLSSRTVSVLDAADNAVVATVRVGKGPHDVAVSPSGDRVYVANFFAGTVSVLDGADHVVLATVKVGLRPISLAMCPSGDRVYVANRWSQSISVLDARTGVTARTFPLSTRSLRRTAVPSAAVLHATALAEPWGIAVSPDGTQLLAALWDAGTVLVTDPDRGMVVSEVSVSPGRHSAGPSVIAPDPRGGRFYVACVDEHLAILSS